jgi:Rrf2 family protein
MLNKKAKYAIKALVTLAKHNPEEPNLRINDIAQKALVPKKFLEAILLELRKNGILGSKLGFHGGYYLMRKAEDIKLVEVMRLMQGPIALIPCASLNFYEPCDDCEDEATCGLRTVVTEIRVETLKIINNRSIADLVALELASVKTKKKNKSTKK